MFRRYYPEKRKDRIPGPSTGTYRIALALFDRLKSNFSYVPSPRFNLTGGGGLWYSQIALKFDPLGLCRTSFGSVLFASIRRGAFFWSEIPRQFIWHQGP